MSDTQPISLPAPNRYWGRRSGTWVRAMPKGMSTPFGWAFTQKRGSANGGTSNSGPVGKRARRWYAKLHRVERSKKGSH